jgi:hypothetical protein
LEIDGKRHHQGKHCSSNKNSRKALFFNPSDVPQYITGFQRRKN